MDRSPRRAYPWAILSPRIEQIDYVVGTVSPAFVDQLITALNGYIERENDE